VKNSANILLIFLEIIMNPMKTLQKAPIAKNMKYNGQRKTYAMKSPIVFDTINGIFSHPKIKHAKIKPKM
jgi:hypothetical protein